MPANLPQSHFADKSASDFTSDQNGSRPEGYDDLIRFARLQTARGVVEVRVLGIGGDKRRTAAGWFNDPEALANEALRYSGAAKAVYVTLNPVDPALLALSHNRLTEGMRRTSRDADVLVRCLLLIDVDPRRPADTSATDEEKANAAQVVKDVLDYLTGRDWPEPIEADSGNGGHLDYLIDLPADDGGLVKRVLRALAARFNTAEAEIDCTVFNASRICKLPGTWACKGESTPERPHRLARLLRVPDELVPVSREQLEAVATEAPEEGTTKPRREGGGGKRPRSRSRAAGNGPPRTSGSGRDALIARARAYVARMPSAKSGRPAAPEEGNDNHGHNQTFCVAATLVRDFDLTVDEARPVLQEYGDRCEPPWSEAELEHKLADADTFDGERGRLARDGNILANYRTEAEGEGEDAKQRQVFLSAETIAAALSDVTDGWPKRVGGTLFAPADEGRPLYLEDTAALFAWAGRQVSDGGDSRLFWAKGPGAVSQEQFLAHLQQTAECFDAVEAHPHQPAMPRTYYLHPPLQGGDGTALAELLARFSPAGPVDRDLIKAFFLSLVWGGPCGQRPAWVITSDEDGGPRRGRGTGKTSLARMAAALVGGYLEIRHTEAWPALVKRLLSPAARDKRLMLLDNLKSFKLSWSDLEGAVTADVVSGHQLYAGEGRRPNTLTWVLTLNGAALSEDLAQRAVFVRVSRPAYAPAWEAETRALVEGNRWAILGDLVAELRRGGRLEAVRTRWGAWEAEVLACVADPAACQAAILERQAEADDDRQEAALVREELVRWLAKARLDPEKDVVFIPSRLAAEAVNEALGERRPTNRAMTFFNNLGIAEVSPSRRGQERGCVWTGSQAAQGRVATVLPEWVAPSYLRRG
jgi:hypothetical protein